jgi:hypothetical protein
MIERRRYLLHRVLTRLAQSGQIEPSAVCPLSVANQYRQPQPRRLGQSRSNKSRHSPRKMTINTRPRTYQIEIDPHTGNTQPA